MWRLREGSVEEYGEFGIGEDGKQLQEANLSLIASNLKTHIAWSSSNFIYLLNCT